MSRILIHPGFHKTGTTFLQECVFADARYFNALLSHYEVHDLLVDPGEFGFDAEAVIKRVALSQAASIAGVIPVISSEILSGNPLHGARDSAMIARRLANVFPEARILLTVREQVRFTKSLYLQYLKRGGRKSPEGFLTFRPEPGYHWFTQQVLHFDALAEYYASLFGAENVLVLPQELLRSDRESYLKALFAFTGGADGTEAILRDNASPKGLSPPASSAALLKTANLLRTTPLNPEGPRLTAPIASGLVRMSYHWPFGKEGGERKLSEHFSQALSGQFGEANKRLQAFCPVDLAEFGYDVA